MIWVLAGTREGREMVGLLEAAGRRVLATAVTAYGGELLRAAGASFTKVGPLSREGMATLIREQKVSVVVDATHPFACEASRNVLAACRLTGVPYYRLEREPADLSDHPLITRVGDYVTAAIRAAEMGEVIFLTTGSKSLEVFLKEARERGRRLIARVLPQPEVVARCLSLGMAPADIIGMQGPFSREFNRALFREYGASVVVTKESGRVGGVVEKVQAALDLSLPVVVVERPPCSREILDYLEGGTDEDGGGRCRSRESS